MDKDKLKRDGSGTGGRDVKRGEGEAVGIALERRVTRCLVG